MEYLRKTDVYAKTIIFCTDTEHAARMRQAIINEAGNLALKNHKYVMRITGEDKEGKQELDNFINPEERYPVIATTSKLMTTGVDAQTCKLIVLDTNIESPTEFKQIIGRGTRINEQFDKQFFTIMDFRNVTDQFADPNFNHHPIMIKELGTNQPLTIDDINGNLTEAIIDQDTGEVIDFSDSAENFIDTKPKIIQGGNIVSEKRDKIYITGVSIAILNERVQYLNEAGELVTTSLRDYTKQNLLQEFSSLDNFLTRWNEADKKAAVIAELRNHDIIAEELEQEIKKDLDLFDLICYVAWNRPPLTRKQRAENVKKRDYFTKYGEKARDVLNALLEKYANEGIENIEDLSVLKLEPLKQFGSPPEIVKIFGGKSQYISALRELTSELYKIAA